MTLASSKNGSMSVDNAGAGYDLQTQELDVLRAAYIRAGQSKTDDQLNALLSKDASKITFDPSIATESDIVGLLGKLGLTDASVPPPDAPVPLTRTLPRDSFPAFGNGPDITGMTASQLGALLDSGAITSREIVLQYIYRIQQYDHAGPALRAVAQINPDILELADQADAERAAAKASGRTLPPLFGVPALVKLNIDTDDGLFTTAGDDALIGSKPSADATLIEGMREQGLIILGKANMGQWAGVVSNNDSSTGGQSIDPRDPKTVVGGSSSGPAISMAMGFAPITVGTQTSDSIIYPASQQGVYALKATEGLVSTTGVAPYSHYIDSAGPMANSVEDLALALNGMVKQDQIDTRAAGYVRPADYSAGLTGNLSGMRVGVFTDTYDPTYHAAVEGMLASAGATVVKVDRNAANAAVQTALSALSPADLQTFNSFAPQGGSTDSVDLLAQTNYNAVLNFVFGDFYNSVTSYLAQRVSSSSDYQSAYVRLLGDKFSALNGDTSAFARTTADLAAFAAANPALDSGDSTFSSFSAASKADSAAYQNYIRIATSVVTKMRSALGIDAGIGFIGPDDGGNDGLSGGAAYGFVTDQASGSPQLTVPVEINGKISNILIDGNAYSEQTLLKIGAAFEKQLNTDTYKQYKVVPPHPPATGFAHQPKDDGALLPLVFNNLDDHGHATPAHLLSTVMAPLTLNVTTTTGTPLFDGPISGDGGLIKEGAGVQQLTGTSDFKGPIQVWQGGLEINDTKALGAAGNKVTLEKGSALDAATSLSLARAIGLKNGGTLGVQAGATMVESGVISGNGGLAKTGGGQLVLAGANAFTGGLEVQQGSVSAASDQAFGQDYGALTFEAGTSFSATASFTTHRQIHLAGTAGIALGAGIVLTARNLVDGLGGLTLSGSGTLDLESARNAYSGGIVLNGGTLELGALGASGAGAITFGAGAQTLKLDATGALPNSLMGFGPDDAIDLGTIAFGSGMLSYGNGVLSVTGGTQTTTLHLGPAPAGYDFAMVSDGTSGTDIVEKALPGSGGSGGSGGSTGGAASTVADLDPTSQLIEHLYFAVFDRPATAKELAYWDAVYNAHPHQRTLRHVARDALRSAEFKSLHGHPNDRKFVDALYENVLGRAAEASTLHHDVHRLQNGKSRASLAVSVAESPEATGHLAGKAVDVSGLAYWESIYNAHPPAGTWRHRADDMTEPKGFFGSHPNGQGFVNALYEGALGGSIDASALHTDLHQGQNGSSHAPLGFFGFGNHEATGHLGGKAGA